MSHLCLRSDHIKVYQDILDGARQFILKVCKEGDIQSGEWINSIGFNDNQGVLLQSDYLKYSPCYQRVSADPEKCSNQLRDAMDAPSMNEPNETTKFIMKKSCW